MSHTSSSFLQEPVPPWVYRRVQIFSDGACSGNPGPGGWGAWIRYTDGECEEYEICGGEEQTTNNRMELMAALRALEYLQQPCRVNLLTDSRYLQQGICEWLSKWQKNGWHTSNKKPVKNQDLWQSLNEVRNWHQVDWRWVKGHSGDPGNERADMLARKGMPVL